MNGKATATTIEATERIAGDEEGRQPETRPISPSSGATPKSVPAAVATALPPFRKRRKSGRQCPSIAAPAGERAGQLADERASRGSAGTNPFAMSSRTTGIPYQRP